MERLSHKINDLVTEGIWKPLKFGRGVGPIVSHVCFADDLILIAEANLDQINLIKGVLDEFCLFSGQKVNLGKSKVFFSNNISLESSDFFSRELGIDRTADLGTYLGSPMLHQRISKHCFSYIIDKMKKKLNGWKAKTLSFAGRVTLAQSSLSCIPGYAMQTAAIPSSICEDAERVCRNFIWGSSNEHRKCYLVAWEKICQPKEAGGLGFRSLKVLNQAYMLKLAWQITTETDKLWVRIVKSKYNCGNLLLPNISQRSSSTNVWKAISRVWNTVKSNLDWVIKDDQQNRFWRDSWVPGCNSIESYILDEIPSSHIDLPVSYYSSAEGWN